MSTPAIENASLQQSIDITLLLRRYLEKDPLELAFSWCVTKVLVPEPPQPPSLFDVLHKLFSTTNHDQWVPYINSAIKYMMAQSNPHRVVLLNDTLNSLVAQSIIPARLVCEAVLQQLDIKNLLTWQHGLSLVRNVVGGVDYKGCRELMKLILDRFDKLPRSIPENEVHALHAGRELLAYMLDRKAALLPAYIAYDEIKLRYSNKDYHPHWALRDITGTLNGSMEVVANIVSGRMLSHLVPIVGISHTSWKLDQKYFFLLPGRLPYTEVYLQPQKDLVSQVIIQPQSKDLVVLMLSHSKQLQPNPFVEDCMKQLILEALSKTKEWKFDEERVILTWSHLATQLILFSLIHLVNSNKIFGAVKKNLCSENFTNSRCYFMWMLQYFLSGSVTNKDQANVREECTTIINLINSLYSDNEPLPIPDTSSPQCVYELAPAGLWILLTKKAQIASIAFPSLPPNVLSKHIVFLQEKLDDLSATPPSIPSWYMLTALLNAYCLSNDISNNILNALLNSSSSIKPQHQTPDEDESALMSRTAIPLSMDCVNLMVMQAKVKMSDKIKVQLMRATDALKQPHTSESSLVTPALLETFSRVLLWSGTKNFQSQLIPVVFKLQAWSMLQSLLEIVSYRVHSQLPTSLRFSILQLLHSIAGVSIIPAQLFICAENTALYLIQGLIGFELPIQLAKNMQDPKLLFHADSDELNKVLLLVLAQCLHCSRVELSVHVWLENLLKDLEVSHPNSLFLWPESTLAFLPQPIKQHCNYIFPIALDSRRKLISRVEEEHQKLQSKTENELHQMYNEGDSSLYILCVIWKQLLESGQITALLSRVLQRLRLSPKKLASFARVMVDYIIYTCPQPATPSNPKFVAVITHLNNLIWKYFFFPLDRFLLCILWRSYGGKDALLGMTLIYQLLMRDEIKSRVNDFVKTVPCDVWHDSEWGQKHGSYLATHSECFQFDASGTGTMSAAMPMHFGNICLRLLPVIDLTIQRMLENPDPYQSILPKVLEYYKPLYKYHQYPVRFLYTLMHYYNTSLVKHPKLRNLLVSSILGSFQHDTLSLYFSPLLIRYITDSNNEWSHPPDYWKNLLLKLFQGLESFSSSAPPLSWPLSEFTSSGCCLIYSSSVEIMTLPFDAKIVSKNIIDTIVSLSTAPPITKNKDILSIINGAGALFSALPDMYSLVIYNEILELVQTPPLSTPPNETINCLALFASSTHLGCLLNLFHAFLHHCSVSVISGFTSWMRTQLKPLINNELQLLYLCHLLGPLINRLASEKPTLLLEVVLELYQFIHKVDQLQGGVVQNCDALCDLLYHIKYMHIGDLKKEEIEKIVTSLHPPLRMRLRFLVHTLASSKTGIDNKQHSAGVTPTMFPSTSIATMISMSESMDTS